MPALWPCLSVQPINKSHTQLSPPTGWMGGSSSSVAPDCCHFEAVPLISVPAEPMPTLQYLGSQATTARCRRLQQPVGAASTQTLLMQAADAAAAATCTLIVLNSNRGTSHHSRHSDPKCKVQNMHADMRPAYSTRSHATSLACNLVRPWSCHKAQHAPSIKFMQGQSWHPDTRPSGLIDVGPHPLHKGWLMGCTGATSR